MEAILRALGLKYSNTEGGHDFWKGVPTGWPCKVTVDPKYAPFSPYLLQFMVRQANPNRKEFYGAIASAAAKIAKWSASGCLTDVVLAVFLNLTACADSLRAHDESSCPRHRGVDPYLEILVVDRPSRGGWFIHCTYVGGVEFVECYLQADLGRAGRVE